MPWNSPGNNNEDPWKKNSNNQNPPDLDEIFQNLSRKFGGIFGGGKGGGTSSSSGGGGGGLIIVAVVVAGLLWLGSGIYKITEGEAGVILRFGEYADTTGAGLHWHFPYPIEELRHVDMQQVRSTRHQTTMLTKDENIVEIILTAQYRVKNAADYLFNVRNPDVTLKQAMESAIREIVGKNKVDSVLYEGREIISSDTKQLIQEIIDRYETGLILTSLNLEQTQPPSPVQSAFQDVIKSREDLERFIQEAEAYANTIVPQARGEAARIVEEANAYKEAIVAKAEGEAERFLALLTEYKKAPSITRERLYLEATQAVYSNSTKIIMDVDGGNNLLYLPIDKIIEGNNNKQSSTVTSTPNNTYNNSTSSNDNSRRSNRGREVR